MNFTVIKDDDAIVSIQEFAKNGVDYAKVSVNYEKPTKPSPLYIRFYTPITEVSNVWTPIADKYDLRADWYPNECCSSLAKSLPIIGYVSDSGENRFLVSASDVKNTIKISVGVVEETCEAVWTVKLFENAYNKISDYEITLRFDRRNLRFTDCVKSATAWWEETGYVPAYVPEDCYKTTYSTWYNFHQKITPEDMLSELEIAKDLGFKTIIVDDGWQCLDNNRGYAYTGDWAPQQEKIGDVREFCDKCHEMGINVMIWYSVPFVGKFSKNFERFKNRFLRTENGGLWGVLDPRYAEVRDFLVDLYRNAMINYGLDGLKLDFIDSFFLTDESPEPNDEMDVKELPDAVYKLMCSVYKAVTEVKTDAMIEFRQNYVGPAIRSFGNMLRVTDCPMSAESNIRGIAELRLHSGNTAVHSDMLEWNFLTSREDAAKQLLATLFSVPQISVMLRNLPESHMAVLKEFVRYREENLDVLMHGAFDCAVPFRCDYMTAKTAEKSITALYRGNLFTLEDKNCDVFFASSEGDRVLDLTRFDKTFTVTVKDCAGKTVSTVTLKGLCKVYVPTCGRVEIRID